MDASASIILIIVLAIISGNISRNRGYSFIGGFLWVLILGVIGFLVVILTPHKASTTHDVNPIKEQQQNIPQDNNPIK